MRLLDFPILRVISASLVVQQTHILVAQAVYPAYHPAAAASMQALLLVKPVLQDMSFITATAYLAARQVTTPIAYLV